MLPVLAWENASEAGTNAAIAASPASLQSLFMSPPSFGLSRFSALRFAPGRSVFPRARAAPEKATALPPRKARAFRTSATIERTRSRMDRTARGGARGAIQKFVEKIRILDRR